ncbi:hypothetical protein AURDEDRAFT_168304 [Auricularia subglabra TFB-10046 SS5]|nr:hypothetical protein AURDEDRAFT_168304 [Auricularia subglabra TFB-10046 SS5]
MPSPLYPASAASRSGRAHRPRSGTCCSPPTHRLERLSVLLPDSWAPTLAALDIKKHNRALSNGSGCAVVLQVHGAAAWAHNRVLRFAGNESASTSYSAVSFIVHTAVDIASIARLEACSTGWTHVRRLVPALPDLQVLALHILDMGQVLASMGCALLLELVLQLHAHPPPACFRVEVGGAMRFLAVQLIGARRGQVINCIRPWPTDTVFPLDNIFSGHAPLLTKVEGNALALAQFSPGAAVPAFSAVESLYLMADPRLPLGRTLSVMPNLRRLTLSAGPSTRDVTEDPTLLASLRLEHAWFASLPDDWARTLAALDVARIPDLVLEARHGLVSATFTDLCGRYAPQLRGPLELSFLECRSPTIDSPRVLCCVAFRSRRNDRALRFVGTGRRGVGNMAATFKVQTHLDVARIARLEVCSLYWEKVRTVVPVLPGLEILALHIDAHYEDDPPSPVSCPCLREVALQLCAHAPSACFRVNVSYVAHFLAEHVVVTHPPSLVVCKPLVLVGDRALLSDRVERIEEL